jgi:hypothetical protein
MPSIPEAILAPKSTIVVTAILLSLAAAFGAGASPYKAGPEIVFDRTAREAGELFQFIMSKEQHAAERCQFDNTWARYPVPAFVARAHLGSKLHADLSAPFDSRDFHKTIDPENKVPFAFCSSDERKAYIAERVQTFEAGTAPRMEAVKKTEFTFPIFDEQFRTAIVVVIYTSTDGRFRLNNNTHTQEPFLAVYANVFRKDGGMWRLKISEMLGIT